MEEGRHSAHALLAPSASFRWLNCPGSIAAGRETPPEEAGEAAISGTWAHEVVELALRLDLPPDAAQEAVELPESTDPTDYEVGIELCIEKTKEIIRGIVGAKVSYEVFLDPGIPSCTGHSDVVAVNKVRGALIDFKFGINIIEPSSTQLAIYAIGVFMAHPKLQSLDVWVLQPRARHADGWARMRVMNRAEAMKLKEEYTAQAQAALAPGAPRRAGAWCRYCPARAECAEVNAYAEEKAQEEFADIVYVLDGEEIAERLRMLPVLKEWIADVERLSLEAAMQGTRIPGFAVGRTRGSRRWALDDGEVVGHLGELGLDLDTAAPRKLLSPHGAETALRKIGVKKVELEPIVDRYEGAPKIVPDSDPSQEEAPPDAESEFADIKLDLE